MLDRPSPLAKFTETGWRWIFYFTLHMVSVVVMWNKPWVWDTYYCWYDYPFHVVGQQTNDMPKYLQIYFSDPAVWWHYMWELAFYWSLFISQFFDAKRKVVKYSSNMCFLRLNCLHIY